MHIGPVIISFVRFLSVFLSVSFSMKFLYSLEHWLFKIIFYKNVDLKYRQQTLVKTAQLCGLF